MIFITLMVLTTFAIAGSAAFFSVYGLAATFSGTFWSVVVMGTSLEAGKLMAASYLYRQWVRTNIWLKSYLMLGILALMVLTSTGIFGYLSSGYQTDVLPLKQIEAQVKLLESEKERLLARKTQIDDQIAKLPSTTVQGRVKLMKGFKDEQASVTTRITELDKTMLEEKQKLIKTQAHIGPITYIAAAFDLDTDNATKYLIYLIIFAFDPMAVALTLATNILFKQREDEKLLKKAEHKAELERERLANIDEAIAVASDIVAANHVPPAELVEEAVTMRVNADAPPPVEPVVEPEPVVEEIEITPATDDVQTPSALDFTDVEPEQEDPEPIHVAPTKRRHRAYSAINGTVEGAKLDELVKHYQFLKAKEKSNEPLTQDDRWELAAIEDLLRKQGLGMYLT